jgi:phage shock protein A
MGDVGLAIQRAEDKTATMQARAGAIDELLASGALDDASGQPNDDISRELAALSAGSDVDAELARLKGQLEPGSAPKALDSGAEGTGSPQAEQQKQPEGQA